MKWRIYYGDGTDYNGESDQDAFQVPSPGAIILKQAAENPRGYSIRGGVFYCWERITLSGGRQLEEGRWGVKDDLFGLMDYYSTHKGPQKVLIGREIHDETYIEISKRAATDGCLCDIRCDHIIPRIK